MRFSEIVSEEHRLATTAAENPSKTLRAAFQALHVSSSLPESIHPTHVYVGASFTGIVKAGMLALLSVMRRHSAQAQFNLRQVIEYTSICAFACAHGDVGVSSLDQLDSRGAITNSDALLKAAQRWLKSSLPQHSDMLKSIKDHANTTLTHASLTSASQNFSFEADSDGNFSATFFDRADEFYDDIGAWEVAQALTVSSATLATTAVLFDGFMVNPFFAAQHAKIATDLGAIEAELRSNPRYIDLFSS